MLKKILLGMGLIGALATAGFSEEIKSLKSLDSETCKINKIINQELFNNEGQCNLSRGEIIGGQNAINDIFTSMFGQISTDLLKETGIGYSVNLNWGNIDTNINEFICYMKANNKNGIEEIRKFIMSAYKTGMYKNFDKENFKRITLTFSYLFYNTPKSKLGEVGDEYLLEYFASERALKNKKVYSPFMKYIINKDYKRAEAYIKDINAKSGINEVFSEIENDCQKLK
jgi:hypothetical protein